MGIFTSSVSASDARARASWQVVVSRALVAQFAPDRTLLWCNPQFEERFGVAIGNPRGKLLDELLRVDSEGELLSEAHWQRLATEDIPISRVAAHSEDGNSVWLRATFTRVLDRKGKLSSILMMANDVTEEVIVNAENDARIAAITRSQLVLELQLDGTIAEANERICEALGMDRAHLIGRHLQSLCSLAEGDQPDWDEVDKTVRGGDAASAKFAFERRSGQSLKVRSRLFPLLDPEGRPKRVLLLAIDITHEQRLESRLERAESAAKSKAAFLAHMSHEVRTPMAGVMGYAELLKSFELGETADRYVGLIHESGEKMMQLLNDILDVSKIEAGQMHIAREQVQLRHKIGTCVTLMKPIAEQKGLKLVWECAEDLPETIILDRLRLRQVLLNLIGNAVKFTKVGTVRVEARRDPKDPDQFMVEVTDTGIGIPEDRLEFVLGKFVQADASVSDSFGGTGLGLTITSELAELMGGSFSLESTLGVGTRATIRLPLVEDESALEEEARSETKAPAFAASAAEGPRVLVAEDNEINQTLVLEQLKLIGISAEIAPDGKHAVNMVQRAAEGGKPYALIFMDLRMPGMDGFEATRALRAVGHSPESLPIIALTANAYEEDIRACAEAWMQGHLSKPTDIAALSAEIEKRLSEPEPVAGLTKQDNRAPRSELEARYLARRDETLHLLARLASGKTCEPGDLEELTGLLHKLGGTAGHFGEAALGEAALRLERSLKQAHPEELGASLKAADRELADLATEKARRAA